MEYHLIIGRGTVGNAIKNILKPYFLVATYDIANGRPKKPRRGRISVLHICYPYNKDFVHQTKKYQQIYKPKLTIIHSTVAVGTTKQIPMAVHSPVRGVDASVGTIPNSKIEHGLRGWEKQIGGPNKYAKMADRIFRKAGLKTITCDDSQITELGKLLCNIQWALSIAFTQEMDRMCKKFNLNFDQTVKEMNQMYNRGVNRMGRKYHNRLRSVCFPGYIDGSCLMENIKILEKQYPSEFLDLIKKSNQRFKQDLRQQK